MFNKLKNIIFKKKEEVEQSKPDEKISYFSTDRGFRGESKIDVIRRAESNVFQRTVSEDVVVPENLAMDDAVVESFDNTQSTSLLQINSLVSDAQISWYSAQSFIGFQLCSIIAQQWLVDKVCEMPARDAIRKGYEITVNDGNSVSTEVLDCIKSCDIKYRISKNLVEFVKFSRVFGIRIAMFKIEGPNIDPQYYEKPFNIDGVTPGSYKGIVQIDPFWITPLLDLKSASDPSSLHFYEPTWWQINGKKIHRTHLVITRTNEVSDILKPTYLYAGLSIPQKIYERIYASERTANEAPLLAMTKRIAVIKTDTTQIGLDQCAIENRIRSAQYYRDNGQVTFVGLDEEYSQLETSLADLDAVIMSQYQLVAGIANVPVTKLFGTTPKGFNTTGEFEEANYHEELESIQHHDLTPFLDRHYLLLIKSEICPKFNIEPFTVCVSWNCLDSYTTKEKAEINKTKAETGAILVGSGVISSHEELVRLVADKDSGYNGIKIEDDEEDEEESEEDNGEELEDGY